VHGAYVTGGTVGVGDLMHGVALRAAAHRAGSTTRVTLVSPPLPFPALRHLDDHVMVEMRAQTLLNPQTVEQTPLYQALQALRADVVVVGHFWANVHFVLPRLDAKAVLLLRKAPPVWVVGPPVAPFSSTRRNYERVFEIEPVGFAGHFERLPPLVVANRDELLAAPAARRVLLGDDDDGRPLRLCFQAGVAGEAAMLSRAEAGWHTVACDLHSATAPWPMAPLLDGADEIVTGAGYNAWWETQWLGVAHKARFVPFARSIDDQAWRMALPTTTMTENGADVLLRLLECG
jgi:hypothetical protein